MVCFDLPLKHCNKASGRVVTPFPFFGILYCFYAYHFILVFVFVISCNPITETNNTLFYNYNFIINDAHFCSKFKNKSQPRLKS